MSRATKRTAGKKKSKLELSERSRALLERIRYRREAIREPAGILSDSSELIREERDRRY